MDIQTPSVDSASISVRVLQPKFDESIPRYWFAGNSYLTHLIHVLSFQFPPGEENFVKSVKYYAGQIQDPTLKKAIVAFSGQELQHGKIHENFNKWIAEKIPSAEGYCKQVERALRWQYTFNLKHNPLRNLAATVVCEHLTVVMAANLLSKPHLMAQMDPQVRALLMWHAIEEIEHRSVAFDVYRAVGGGYWQLILTQLQVTISFTLSTVYFHLRLLWDDRQLFKGRAFLGFLSHFYGKNGFFSGMGKRYLRFFSPRFHPALFDDLEHHFNWDAQLAELTPVRVTFKVTSPT